LRKRQLIQAYIRNEREGCYWGIRSDIRQYEDPPALDCPYDRTMLLAETPTRLAELEGRAQERIINWGYAICDAAMRKHVIKGAAAPAGFPYPDSGIGQ
jgi:NTE family protein